MQISFWGVRGSTPTPARHTWRYGGNTPCLELRAADQLIVLDAGTGIRELGNVLLGQSAGRPIDLHLLFSHYHWDHIQGLPFFLPIYMPGNVLRLRGPRFADVRGSSLTAALEALFCAPFFPVVLSALQATHPTEEFEPGAGFTLGSINVRTCRLNHPQGSVAYRFETDGANFVYATDHEPGNEANDSALRQLARGADLLIADAQYRPEQLLAQRKGWGHGSWEHAARMAAAAEAKNLVLFHHEPTHTDEALDQILHRTRQVFPNTWSANENLILEIERHTLRISTRPARLSQRADINLPVEVETTRAGALVHEHGQLANLSFQGAFLLTPHPYEPQQPIEIRVPLQTTQESDTARQAAATPGEFRLRGYVLRSEPQTTDGHWVGLAIHFPDTSRSKPEEKPAASSQSAPDSSSTPDSKPATPSSE